MGGKYTSAISRSKLSPKLRVIFPCSDAFPFRIEKDEKRGRHLIAMRDIRPLELIMRDKPRVLGPTTRGEPRSVCLGCLRLIADEDSIRCSNCR